MNDKPSISVIVRTFDRNQFLREALESLAQQSRQDFEVVVVDMNRTSASSVLEALRQMLPGLVHLQVGKLMNGPSATNLGIRKANSDKIAILDDDNRYDRLHIESLVEGLEGTGADLVYTGVRRTTYTPDGQLVDVTEYAEPYDFNRLLHGNYIHTVGTAFWKSTWQRLGGFDARFPVLDDYEFLLRVAASGRIEFLPCVTAESRSFTGQAGVQNHAVRQTRQIGPSLAGIHWVHKDLYLSEEQKRIALALRVASKTHVTGRPLGEGKISRTLFRARLTGDLIVWWCCYALPHVLVKDRTAVGVPGNAKAG